MPFRARQDPELEPDAIRASHHRIHPAFRNSPQFVHEGLSVRAGVPIIVKVETVNPIRAFKGRGTWLAVAGLAGEGSIGPGRPVVAASTGNFGQGVAFAARDHYVPAVIFADEHANPTKLDRGDPGLGGGPPRRRGRTDRRHGDHGRRRRGRFLGRTARGWPPRRSGPRDCHGLQRPDRDLKTQSRGGWRLAYRLTLTKQQDWSRVVGMGDAVNIHEAKTHLSRLITRVEAGEEILIARGGRPVARLVPLGRRTQPRELGRFRDKIWLAPDWDSPDTNAAIAADFEG